MRKTFNNNKLDIIIPIMIEQDWPDKQTILKDIRFQKEQFGFTRFLLSAPSTGWRKEELPPISYYEKMAAFFAEIRDELLEDGIECGWWNMLTIKSGAGKRFQRIIRMDGEEAPFSSCPLDPNFQKAFAEVNARFCEIAKPAFVFFEDDYSVVASGRGCFCKYHLEEFAKREGKAYTREELLEIFEQQTPESYELLRRWRKLAADSMVSISEAVRREVDKKTPEIPFGSMQPGSSDVEGNSTERVARALAGPNHTPFSRLFGVKYCDMENGKNLPEVMYHPIYMKEHIYGDFCFYHESDTFPHTRFFVSSIKMRALMSVMYSHGFDGSTFQTCQLVDDCTEEHAYGMMFAKERNRFNEINRISKLCERKGVEIGFDPFWNTVNGEVGGKEVPYWTQAVSLFGIPYVTVEADVAFWDERQAKYAENETIIKYLSKGLFLDGAAAKELCKRGYGKYLGVEIGEDIAKNRVQYDLGAREIIKEPFGKLSKGKNMPSAHMFTSGRNGKLLEIEIRNPQVEVISQAFTFKKELLGPAMVRYENELGGRIVVMGMTLKNNRSQSLLNYRRQKLIQELLDWCSESYIYVKDQPNIYVVVNKAINPEKDGFEGMFTFNNLGEDSVERITLNMPKEWQKVKEFFVLDKNGEWIKANIEKKDSELIINEELRYCEPMYILCK